MCRNKPDSEFAALLKRHESHTAFMYGNAMNAEDLKLVAVSVLISDLLIPVLNQCARVIELKTREDLNMCSGGDICAHS